MSAEWASVPPSRGTEEDRGPFVFFFFDDILKVEPRSDICGRIDSVL